MQTILAVWSACVQVRNCRPFCKHWKLPKCQLSRPILFRSILALSKPYRSHCLNRTGLLATKCSKSTTAKNFHQETTHILNSFYSCSCYHFIPAAVIISFLQLLSFHSCSCFKTNKSAYTWHQSLFPQVVNHFFSGQDCCWSGGKPTWGWRIKVGWNFIWFPCHKKQAFTTCIARGGLRSWPCWSGGKPTCVNVKTTFKS